MKMERLIELVRTFPVLYDPRHKDYTRTNLKDHVWEHIARKLDLPNGEAAKTHWGKLRNCYRVSLWRQMKKRSGQSDAFIRPWLYQKKMEFLLPYMRNYRSLGELIDFNDSHENDHNYGEDGDANNEAFDYASIVNEFETSKKHKNTINGPETFDYNNLECELKEMSPKKLFPSTKKSKPSLNSSEEKILLKTLKSYETKSVASDLRNSLTNISSPKNPNSDDPLFSFFISMYNTTKSLPVRQQLEVRRQVFNLVTKIEENVLINESVSDDYSEVVVVRPNDSRHVNSTYISDSSQWRQ
ncbi:hypothetical protein LSTR_LSTR009289 [Laodelphax striatellus]|uniref:MADF domain-containing protein n=1 Tax=Laodelphax striatellus TaxID=195883 RepID=A0A482XLE9_LAOST|nr:hypothetical protein LSTR_LSTR009289 [Laodelphax striatellus]